ncbi:hypothetical protein [uncultured Campylobacter sp.]|uniref:hypothetical protein n=1 Tax=uncultured Campylobacter sp. TaxID=218934 RepID=UPI0026212145|nr:hypothetical protein [uncultured Campylobacter sp.]
MKKFLLLPLVCGALFAAPSCDNVQLKAAVEGINKSAPLRVDEITTLTGAECKDGTFIYNYELNDGMGLKFDSINDTQKNVMQNVVGSQNKQIFCENMKVMHSLINSAVWVYKLKNGSEFMRVEFKPSDCN